MNSRICSFIVLLSTLGLLFSATSLEAQCIPTVDCNANGLLDSCDLMFGMADDCNLNSVPDECDIAAGTSEDCNLDGIPDECEPVGERRLSPNGAPQEFGHSVAIAGDYAVVGDPGLVSIGGFANSGSAWVYHRVGTQWVLETQLLPSDPAADLNFGEAVAISNDLIAIGAPGAGTVLNPNRGAVYVFRKFANNWVQQAKLTGSDAGNFDELGISVAVGPELVFAGAWKNDTGGVGSGSVYVYRFNGLSWTQENKLSPAVPETNARFGTAIDYRNGFIAVGAEKDDIGPTTDAGAVYVFKEDGASWVVLGKISSPVPEAGSEFGRTLALDELATRLIVGAPRANGQEGRVFVFDNVEESFVNSLTLLASDGAGENGHLGYSVGFAGRHMFATAHRAGGDTGAAYVYDENGTEIQILNGFGTTNGSLFGFSGAADGVFGLVGAPGDNSTSVYHIVPDPDCNANFVDDICEITTAFAQDCNGNNRPDDCDIADGLDSDCDGNGVPDLCDLSAGTAFDCNLNGVLDVCDLANGIPDCNLNAIPDDCEIDCNENLIPDSCDISSGTSLDCDGNTVPDSCDLASGVAQDCNGNSIPDSCDLTSGFEVDCNLNGLPDSCDIASGLAPDCNANGKIDSCDVSDGLSTDCNLTGTPDECEIASGLSSDCDGNSTPDECELSDGTALDCNNNSILDRCDLASGQSPDCNGNLIPDSCDIASLFSLDCNTNQIPDECEIDPDPIFPVIVDLPADMTVTAEPGLCQASASWVEPTATDNCGVASLNPNSGSGSVFPVGTSTVTYTAIDVSGNQTQASFTVTVTDNEVPTITTQLPDLSLNSELGTCGAVAIWDTPTAEDNCGVMSLTPDHAQGSAFPVGTTTVTYTANDNHGNSSTMSFQVIVTDVELPTIANLPADIVVNNDLGQCGAAVTWTEPAGVDNCQIDTLTTDHASGTVFPVGVTTVTYTTTDIHANSFSASFTVTVNDSEQPSFSGMPADIVLNNDMGQCGAVATWAEPTPEDNCGVSTSGVDLASGEFFPVGTTTVTYSATDLHDNSFSATFTVTVNDNEQPTITGLSADLEFTNDSGACGAVVTWDEPIISDNCKVGASSSTMNSGDFFPVGSTEVVYSATDDHGNSFSASFMVTVDDNELPTISGIPADIFLNNDTGQCGALASWVEPTSADNCGVNSFIPDHNSGDFFPVGVTTVTYTVIDDHDNSAAASFTVTVEDNELPVITELPADLLLNNDLGQCGAVASWIEPLAADNCSIATFVSDHASGDFFAVGTTEVTYTATDIHGNFVTASFMVTVTDNELPAFTEFPADISLTNDAGMCGAIATWAPAMATDNCGVEFINSDFMSGDFFPVGMTTVNFAVTDVHGNINGASLTVTVTDDEQPLILDLPANIVIFNDSGECGAIATWIDPTSTDNCEVAMLTADAASGDFFPVGATDVTYTSTDIHGNFNTATFTVTVEDNELPSILDLPASIALTNDAGECGAVATWVAPTSMDNCEVATLTADAASGDFFPVGSTDVTYTSTDIHGNSTTGTFVVTVEDSELPAIVDLPASILLTNDAGQCGAIATWIEPTATDNCAVETLVSDHASGDFFAIGTTDVIYTATDIHGNFITGTFSVTVEDLENPTILDLPADILLTNDLGQCGAIATWIDPIAMDNCKVAMFESTSLSGDFFSVGSTDVTYTATDDHGNVTSATFVVTVEDNEAPAVVDLPANIMLTNDAGQCGAIATWIDPTATDNCEVATLTADAASGDFFIVGSTDVTYTATDIHGNSITGTFTVTVEDDELPMIVDLPMDIFLTNDLGECGAVATWTPATATDNCGVELISSDFAPGDFFPVGQSTVTFVATDIHGNVTSEMFQVTVEDTELPAILDLPSDMMLTNDLGDCGAIATWIEPGAMDNCQVATLEATSLPGDFFAVGSTAVTYTATDIHGNMITGTFTVTVEDDELPAIVDLPADIMLTNDAGQCGAIATWIDPTATDNCEVATLTADAASGDFFAVGSTAVTYTATDIHGNMITGTFMVMVEDNELPAIVDLPLNTLLTNDAGECGAIATWIDPTATDNCEVATFTADAASGDFFAVGSTAVTYTATDIHGNMITGTFTVTVEDLELPQISGMPSDMTETNDLGACGAIVTWDEPSATDNCAVSLLESDRLSGEFFTVGSHTVTYTLTDIHGNQSMASFELTVLDTELPAISGMPTDLMLDNDAGECGAITSWAAPTAADNCEVASFTSSAMPGDFFPVGSTTVTYTVNDIHGNLFSEEFTVMVIDSEQPVISDLSENLFLNSEVGFCGSVATWNEPTATDNCGVDLVESSHNSGDFFSVGTTTVTYTATDLHGNQFSSSFAVTVEDVELPEIVGLSPDLMVTNDLGECSAVVSWAEVTAADNCEIAQVVSDFQSGDVFPVGTTDVTYVATDIHGNVHSEFFTITVVDQDQPSIVGTPENLVLTNDPGDCGAIAMWSEPTATDNCGIESLSSSSPVGDFFALGDTEVTYTAIDLHGNQITSSFMVTVTDDEVPVISNLSADLVVEAEAGLCSAVVLWDAPNAADNCAVAELLSSHHSGDVFQLGSEEVFYTAIDTSGNETVASFVVTVIDTQAPQILDLPADITSTNDSGVCGKLVTWALPTATDNCAIDTLTSTHQTGDLFPVGMTTVTYTANDSSGNSSSASFTVTIEDTEAPVLVAAPDQIHPAEEAVCFASVVVAAPAVADNCELATLANDITGTSDASGVFQYGITQVTWTATDIYGNSTSAVQLIEITVDETDCNENGQPDVCDLASGASLDCNSNGIPDECEVDCNENGLPDDCDLVAGTSLDTNGNGVPDECEPRFIRGDANTSGTLEFTDAIFMLQFLTGVSAQPECLDAVDVTDDQALNLVDPIALLRYLFLNEMPPAAPFPTCGIDGNGLSIGCENYDACP